MKNKIKEPLWASWLLFIAVAFAVNLWAVLYVNNSRFIYYWDNTLYWTSARSLSTISGNLWTRLYSSISFDEYNMLPVILPSLLMRLFGTSRLVFILSVVNLYFIPTAALIFLMTRKYFLYPAVAALGIILALPIMLFTGLVGFVDVGAMFFALLCMRIYFVEDMEKNTVIRYIAIGILLVAAMLFRRYFAFFAFSFVTAMIGETIIYGKKKAGIVLMCIILALILFVGLREFTFSQLLRDYGSIYSGYRFSLSTDILLFCRYFGALFLVFLATTSVFIFIRDRLPEMPFLWMQSGLCLVMFLFTQTHGQQHLLMYVPAMIMTVLLVLPRVNKKHFTSLCFVVSMLFTGNTLINRVQPSSLSEINHYAVIPDFSMRARVRNDTGEILTLKQYLNETVGLDKKVGVLASGFILNEDILRNCEESLGEESVREDFFINLPSVDSRDTDLSQLFEVDYMVVAYPAQTHMGAQNQRIISEAVACFAENRGFAGAYYRIGNEFKIDGLSVYVYKRSRAVEESEKQEFMKLFT